MSSQFDRRRGGKTSKTNRGGRYLAQGHKTPLRPHRSAVFELLELRELLSGNTYTVTDSTDSASSSGMTLRAAIAAANADTGTGTDTIVLSGSTTYDLTQALGQLAITNTSHALIIEGQGSSGPTATIIDQQFADRVFDVATGVNVTFEDMEITGGVAHDDGSGGTVSVEGGGILNLGTVDLESVVLAGNQAQGSATGAALGGGIFSSGTLTINASTIENNSSSGGSAGGGGVLNHGVLTITGSTIESNSATGTFQITGIDSGGGIDAFGAGIYSESVGAVQITGSTIENNTAQGSTGAAAGSSGTVGNGGEGALGGGIYLNLPSGAPTVTVSGNTVAGNRANGGNGGAGGSGASGGNGGQAFGGGMYVGGVGTAAILNNTISANIAQGGSGGAAGSGASAGQGASVAGGGLFAEFAGTVFQDTIYGNSAIGGGGSIAGNAYGGGIEDDASEVNQLGGLNVLACTITANIAQAGTPTSGGTAGFGQGGGIDNSGGFFAATDLTFELVNTIDAGNTATVAPDLDGSVYFSNDDLIGDGTDSIGLSPSFGDLIGTSTTPINAQLGPLANNGGPTLTVALSTGSQASPALGMGDLSFNTTAGLTTDQRGTGFARIIGGRTDIGAFQTQATPVSSPTVTGGSATEGLQTTNGLIITPSSSGTNYFQITGITGGVLYMHDGLTPIVDGQFITVAQGAVGLKFTPTAGSLTPGNFTVQESTTADVSGLVGTTTSAAITVTFKGAVITVATTPASTQTTTGLVITPGALDTATTYQITGIIGGSLFLNDGMTAVTNNQFITLAQGLAGLKFTPSVGSSGGSFLVQESSDGTAGGLSGPTAAALIVVAGSSVSVDLSGYYNRSGITTDGAGFADGLSGGYAFSAQQLGASLTWNGATFTFGPAVQKNVVTAAGQSITLPTGSYSQLDLLAVGVNGNQPVQRFVVHYTDGTSQIFDQSISDWFTPQSYTGESTALATTYRNTANGGRDSRTFNVYGYSFDIDPSKTIASITLPVNSNVQILAISAIAPSAAAPDLTAVAVSASQVNLSWSIPIGAGITGYNIYRSTVSGGESAPLTSTPLGPGVTSYSDRDVLPGNTYYYTVMAIAGTTLGSSSNEVVATIPTSGLSTEIDLAGYYNLLGMTVDDTQFNTGLNFSGTALSATALGTSKTVGGINFMFSTSTSQNVIRATGQTITLPAQSFGQFDLLATTVNGNQLNVPITVTYTDGTSQTFYQSMSDWFTPQNYAGETLAYATPYRNNSNGTQDARTFDVYEYSFTLNSAKQVQSITLPRDGQVSILSMTGVLPVAPPTNLVVNAASSTEADLIWAAAAGTITGYNVYRGTTAGGESTTPLNSTPLSSSTLSFHDTTALPGNTYYYTVKAIDSPTLGTASNEVSLTMALSGISAEVDLSSEYNTTGITVDGSSFSTGIDSSGFALSASLLGTSQSFGGTTFSIASAGGNNVVEANGQTIGLPNGSYSSVELLATAVNGNQPGQTFIVHYTDGSSQAITQGISDWFSPQSYAGESVALSMSHRNTATGGQDARTFNVYAYSLAVDNSKTISSITLPDNTHVNVLSITTVA